MTVRYHFFAPGRVVTKGSTRAFKSASTGRIVTMQDAKGLKGWEETVATAALAAGVRRIEGPVYLGITAWIRRPKSHYKRGHLRPDMPAYPVAKNRNDLDKIERAICDALEGIAFENDSQVCIVEKRKLYEVPEQEIGAEITIRRA